MRAIYLLDQSALIDASLGRKPLFLNLNPGRYYTLPPAAAGGRPLRSSQINDFFLLGLQLPPVTITVVFGH